MVKARVPMSQPVVVKTVALKAVVTVRMNNRRFIA
jgi:hypothetical protein